MAEQVRIYFNVSGLILGFEPLLCLPKDGKGVFAGASISGEVTIPPSNSDHTGREQQRYETTSKTAKLSLADSRRVYSENRWGRVQWCKGWMMLTVQSNTLEDDFPDDFVKDVGQFDHRGSYLRVSMLLRVPETVHFDALFGLLQDFEEEIHEGFRTNKKPFTFSLEQWDSIRAKYESQISQHVSGSCDSLYGTSDHIFEECQGALWDSFKVADGANRLLDIISKTSSGDIKVKEPSSSDQERKEQKQKPWLNDALQRAENWITKKSVAPIAKSPDYGNGGIATGGKDNPGTDGPRGHSTDALKLVAGVVLGIGVIVAVFYSYQLSGPKSVRGCTNAAACNFDSTATSSDDTCVFATESCEECEDGNVVQKDANKNGICDDEEKLGCTDPEAFNYSPEATENDGSCEDVLVGCMEPNAINYDSKANTPSGDCKFKNESSPPSKRTEDGTTKRSTAPPVPKIKAVQSAIPRDPEKRAELFYKLMSSPGIIKSEYLAKDNLRNLILPQMRGWNSQNAVKQTMDNGSSWYWEKRSIALGHFCLFADLQTFEEREQFNEKLVNLMSPSKERFDDEMLEPEFHPYSWCDCKDNLKRISSELSK